MSFYIRRTYNFIRRHKNALYIIWSTIKAYVIIKSLNTSIGKRCKFFGVPYFDVYKNSIIEIGDGCLFRSTETSNNIGLNHRCILACTQYNSSPGVIMIGNNCGFSGVSIWCVTKIQLGNNVRVGANTLIIDHDAHMDDPRTPAPKPIIIDDNVFIGANCVIKKGVHIGKNAMIGMNSVVTKDIPANCVAVGVPAKVIRQL